MKVTRVRAFRQVQPLRRGLYAMGHVGSTAFDSLVVARELPPPVPKPAS